MASVSAAQALAIIVLPVPGGPNIRHPLGGLIPIALYKCPWVIGLTTASYNSSIYLSNPPIEKKSTADFSTLS